MANKDVNAIKTDSEHSLMVDQARLIYPLTGVCLITRLCAVLAAQHEAHAMTMTKGSPTQQPINPLDHLPTGDDISESTGWLDKKGESYSEDQ